jgi:hypothetical protein
MNKIFKLAFDSLLGMFLLSMLVLPLVSLPVIKMEKDNQVLSATDCKCPEQEIREVIRIIEVVKESTETVNKDN